MDFAVDASLVAVVVAFVQMAKGMGVPVKYAPLLAVILGVGFMAGRNTAYDFETVFNGMIVGLAASGLYSGAKAVSQS